MRQLFLLGGSAGGRCSVLVEACAILYGRGGSVFVATYAVVTRGSGGRLTSCAVRKFSWLVAFPLGIPRILIKIINSRRHHMAAPLPGLWGWSRVQNKEGTQIRDNRQRNPMGQRTHRDPRE